MICKPLKLIVLMIVAIGFIPLISFSQMSEKFDTVVITQEDVYILNSVNNTNLANGRNRNAINYPLPQKTSFLVIQVIIDNSDFQIDKTNYQNLLSKFVSVADNQYLLFGGSIVIASMTPKGSGKACDFYVLKSNDEKEKFMNEDHHWKYKIKEIDKINKYTRTSTQSFVLKINTDDLINKENLSIAFQNHSLTGSRKVIIDLVAFVSKD
jgi:hypothetical protein